MGRIGWIFCSILEDGIEIIPPNVEACTENEYLIVVTYHRLN